MGLSTGGAFRAQRPAGSLSKGGPFVSRNNSWFRRDWRVCPCGRAFDTQFGSARRFCDGCEVKRFFLLLLGLAALAVPVLAVLAWGGVL